MEVVSSKTSLNQAVKTMHSQGTSASLSQQPHIPQSLSNLHNNPNVAHSFVNQHPLSINISSSTAGTVTTNQNQEQASSHPVTSPAGGQSFNIQKTNNAAPVQISPTVTVQAVSNVSLTERPSPEKSQANGTSGKELHQITLTQKDHSTSLKEKPTVQPPTTPQKSGEGISLSLPENSIQISPVPALTTATNAEKAILTSCGVVLESWLDSKKTIVVSKERITSASVVSTKLEKDKYIIETQASSNLEKKVEKSPLSKQISNSESTVEAPKPEILKPECVLVKNITVSENEIAKTLATTDPLKEGSPSEREVFEPKSPTKTTPRKSKNPPIQYHDEPKPSTSAGTSSAIKRQRIRTQHYQSPLPEVEFVSKISSTSMRNYDEKLIVFYKNEFLAVRNAEGGFYLCQAIQNIYKTSSKIKIRWLSLNKTDEKGEIYSPDFYDLIDFDCILTNLSLSRAEKGKYILPPSEKTRTQSILNRSLAVEKGEEIASPSLTEEHPDGLDLSLYRDEDQLKKRKTRKRSRRTLPSTTNKDAPAKKRLKPSKAPKVTTPVKTAVTKTLPRKTAALNKKSLVEPKTVTNAKTSKTSIKANSKMVAKTNPLVDQKKAKVLARIGKKAAVASTSKSPKNSSKNGKQGIKTASHKKAQPKVVASSSTKTTTRIVRKSTRK